VGATPIPGFHYLPSLLLILLSDKQGNEYQFLSRRSDQSGIDPVPCKWETGTTTRSLPLKFDVTIIINIRFFL